MITETSTSSSTEHSSVEAYDSGLLTPPSSLDGNLEPSFVSLHAQDTPPSPDTAMPIVQSPYTLSSLSPQHISDTVPALKRKRPEILRDGSYPSSQPLGSLNPSAFDLSIVEYEALPNPKPCKQYRCQDHGDSSVSPSRAGLLGPSFSHNIVKSPSRHGSSLSPSKLSPRNTDPCSDHTMTTHASSLSRCSSTPLPPHGSSAEQSTPPSISAVLITASAQPSGRKASPQKVCEEEPEPPMKEEAPIIDLTVPVSPSFPADRPPLQSRPGSLSNDTELISTPRMDLNNSAIPIDLTGPTSAGLTERQSDFSDSGEYTGDFTTICVQTKADGMSKRFPASPFPLASRKSLPDVPPGLDLDGEDQCIAGPSNWRKGSLLSESSDGLNFGDAREEGVPSEEISSCPVDPPGRETDWLEHDVPAVTVPSTHESDELHSTINSTAAEPDVLTDVDSDPDDTDADSEEQIVTLASRDSQAAARAAAILKLYDYECHLRSPAEKKRKRLSHTHASVDSFIRDARLHSVSKASVIKQAKRRHTIIGRFGTRVSTPSSKLTALPGLLKEAERVLRSPSVTKTRPFLAAHVPATPQRVLPRREVHRRTWTRDDWQELDGCLTDARLAAGHRRLADVDDVDVEDVLNRFISMNGGLDTVIRYGADWDWGCLSARVRALQRKQRSGSVAPPTPSPFHSISHRFGSILKDPTERPDFTPIPLRRRALLSSSSLNGSLPPAKLPHSSSSPRLSPPPPRHFAPPPITNEETSAHPPSTPSLSRRVKGFLFSYLPTLPKTPASVPPSQQHSAALPLPQPRALEDLKPVMGPPRAPTPILVLHPKDVAHLHPVPQLPADESRSLRPTPQRMVELHTVPSPVIKKIDDSRRLRRSTGGSVKDLINAFEGRGSER